MIYGASGFTGSRTAARAVEMGHRPVLAGRDEAKVGAVAEPLGLEWRAFPADRAGAHVADVTAVLNCAGPFMRTAPQIVDVVRAGGDARIDEIGRAHV